MDPTGNELGAEDVWKLPASQLLARLKTTPAGLSAADVQSRLTACGPNDAATVKRSPLWLQFLGRFRSPLVIILLVASALSAATGDIASFVIVVSIVTISMTLDFVQEVRAQNAVEALRRSVAVQASVRRDGTKLSLPIDQLVPGDIVELIAGDLVPADSRLLESRDLFVNQALLTGEPYPAEKLAGDTASGAENPAGASNAVFAGTSVISGTAAILICRTGGKTALGNLATSLAEKPPATAFAVGIRRFGMLIMRFTVLMVLFVLVVNISFHRPVLESLMFALALAVGLTPELLPMIVTVTLARAAMELAKKKVIVKRLSAIHDLGAMDVLCTDKTGTLTEATIKLVRAIDGRGAESRHAYANAYINSKFESGMKSPLDEAILAARPFDMTGWKKIDEVPFDFERRRVSVLVEHEAKRRLIVKGAPEDLLRLSGRYDGADGTEQPLDDGTRRIFAATLDGLCAQGFRALGIASREVDASHGTAAIAEECDLVFSGFAVFLDPPKASAGATIQAMAAAGISVKVLTGDNELVTRHVFESIGIPVTGVLTGDALAQLSDEALIGQLPQVNLFCRVNPQQKHRILLALKRIGHVVGYMGDGINDAPALHAADVGISVDGRGRCRARRGGSDPARTRSCGRARRRRRRARRGPERLQICSDGFELEFRQYVQHGGRGLVPAVPADAADPDPAQQPALRRFGNRDPVRSGRSRGDGIAREVGHRADRAFHAGVRAGQFHLRLSDILCVAASVRRRRGAVSDRLVHRIDHDAGPGGLRHSHAAAVLPEQAAPVSRRHGSRGRCRRGGSAAPAHGPMVRLRGAAAAVLRLSDRRDGGVSGAGRDRQEHLLPGRRRVPAASGAAIAER